MFATVKETLRISWDWTKKAWASKTVRFSLLLMLLGAIQSAVPFLQHLFSPTTYGIFVMVIGMIVGFLRLITTMPLADK